MPPAVVKVPVSWPYCDATVPRRIERRHRGDVVLVQRNERPIRDRIHQHIVVRREPLRAVELRMIETEEVADFVREDDRPRGVGDGRGNR